MFMALLSLSDIIYDLDLQLAHLREAIEDSKEEHIKKNLSIRYNNISDSLKDLRKLERKLSSLSELI
jgi:hypothetical protein